MAALPITTQTDSATERRPLSLAAKVALDSVLALPVEERIEVVEFIEASLEDSLSPLPLKDFQQIWSPELQRRWEEYESGRDPGISYEQVMADLRARYQS